MPILNRIVVALAVAGTMPVAVHAQDDGSRAVAGGGIHVPGWQGKVDPNEAQNGMTLQNARLGRQGEVLRVTTGPATVYWNPEHQVSGDYTVRATFHEAEYMAINDHPHPYGIVIAGNAMGTETQRYLYCAAYGNGRFIVRGFGPEAFRMNGRGEMHAAVNKAAAKGQPVTQEIAVSVRGDKVDCAINGTVVASYDKSAVVGPGKLSSTNGVAGIRFAHNTDATVTGFSVVRHVPVSK